MQYFKISEIIEKRKENIMENTIEHVSYLDMAPDLLNAQGAFNVTTTELRDMFTINVDTY